MLPEILLTSSFTWSSGPFTRNNKVVDEVKVLDNLRQQNLETFGYKGGKDIVVHKFSHSIRGEELFESEIRDDYRILIKPKGSKKDYSMLDLKDMNIWVEPRPADPNRTKAITANYLEWIEDPRIDLMKYRVMIQIERDLKIRNYVDSKLSSGHLQQDIVRL